MSRAAGLRLRARLSLAFGALMLGVLSVVALGALRLDALNEAQHRAVVEREAKARLVQAIVDDFGVLSRAVQAVLLADGSAGVARELARIQEGRNRVSGALQALDEALRDDGDEVKLRLQAAHDRNSGYLVALTRFTRLVEGGKAAEAKQLLAAELAAQLEASFGAMRDLSRQQSELIEATRADAAAQYRNTRNAVAALVFGAIVLAVLLAAWMARRITAPLAEAVDLAGRVAAGDLTAEAQPRSGDETGQLIAALAAMNGSLTSMVRDVRAISDAIASASGELVAGNNHLQSRTEEQAASLEESASSLQELTESVKRNAASAAQASELARAATSVAERGGAVMNEVVQTMQGIHAGARKAEDIIGVINGIAFQTNILALNAAVEAARAGEQGRGFAVVASEVRSLAQRSAASAKEIRGLIEESVGRVEAGAKLVENAGRTMDELVQSVRRVASIMTEIAAASHEQSSGIEQINKAITQMDHVVQMNASVVEEATAAATSMANQATALARSVAQFQLSEEPQGADRAAQTAKAMAAELARARPIAVERKPAASVPAAPRAQALAHAHDEDWKEF
jgi:methyl-accepting chemotaxis protein